MWLSENDWPETLDPKTIRDRVARYKRYASDRWAGIPLTKIDPLDVKMFYKKLAEDGVGEHTRIALKAGLVRAFNQAITPYRRVPHFWSNPFCLDMPTPARREAVALSPEEAKKALAAKKLDDSRRAMLGVFLLAGMRLGEKMALTRGQLRMNEGLILIDRAVKLDAKSSQAIGLPKSDKVRTAVMCDTLKRLLEPVIEGLDDDELIWPQASENKPRMKALVYATWRRIRKEAGLSEDMSPHDCRLTHINWIEKLCPEVSPTTLKEHMGHSADGVTEVNYTRPISPAQALLRTALDALLN
jgi:integrase